LDQRGTSLDAGAINGDINGDARYR